MTGASHRGCRCRGAARPVMHVVRCGAVPPVPSSAPMEMRGSLILVVVNGDDKTGARAPPAHPRRLTRQAVPPLARDANSSGALPLCLSVAASRQAGRSAGTKHPRVERAANFVLVVVVCSYGTAAAH